jgi:hypothetical protein
VRSAIAAALSNNQRSTTHAQPTTTCAQPTTMLTSLPVSTLKNITTHCGMSHADCFEKPDLVARAEMALTVLRRKRAKLTLQRAARAKIAAMDSARLALVQSALTEHTVFLGKPEDFDAIMVRLCADTRLVCLMVRTTVKIMIPTGADVGMATQMMHLAGRNKEIVPYAVNSTIFDHKFPDTFHVQTTSLVKEITMTRIAMWLEPHDTAQCVACLESTAMDYDITTKWTNMLGFTFQCDHCTAVVCKDCYEEVFGRGADCPVCRKSPYENSM